MTFEESLQEIVLPLQDYVWPSAVDGDYNRSVRRSLGECFNPDSLFFKVLTAIVMAK